MFSKDNKKIYFFFPPKNSQNYKYIYSVHLLTLSNQTINQSRFVEAIFKNTVDWSCNMTMYCVNTMYASPLKKKKRLEL